MSKTIKVPSQMGQRGIPPGVGASKGQRKGIVSPREFGKMGKPGKAGFPGGPAARD